MSETVPTASASFNPSQQKRPSHGSGFCRLLITAACFAYLYTRLRRAAAAEGSRLLAYLLKSFENVNWLHWLALMIPYCFLYLLIRQPGGLERDQLVQRKNPLRGYPAHSRQRLHSFPGERAGQQRRHRALSEPPGRSARLGSRLQHALPHVLRVLQPDAVGDHRRAVAVE